MDYEFKTELKALLEKYKVVFELYSDKVCFYTEGGLGSTVTIVPDPASESLEFASTKIN